jgi:hypothetical protein
MSPLSPAPEGLLTDSPEPSKDTYKQAPRFLPRGQYSADTPRQQKLGERGTYYRGSIATQLAAVKRCHLPLLCQSSVEGLDKKQINQRLCILCVQILAVCQPAPSFRLTRT